MTPEERRLWYGFLRSLNINVNRQKVIGPYIVDFYISSSKVVIEIDGTQHYKEDSIEYDRKRDRYLSQYGIKVLRFSNYDINANFNEVCKEIMNNL